MRELEKLRRAMEGERAAAATQQAVLRVFRKQRPAAVPKWIYAIAAAGLLLAAAGTLNRPKQGVSVPAARTEPAQRPFASLSEPRPSGSGRSQKLPSALPARSRPTATEFLPLPFVPPIPEGEPAQLVRVQLPRAAMRRFGLPVEERRAWERIDADVVIGFDGTARAVRFVSTAY